MNRFLDQLHQSGISLTRRPTEILQVNLGKLCNLTCVHCHVEAGPTKIRENMSGETADAVIALMDKLSVTTLDLTGGAPEMNPHFQRLVIAARKRGLHVIDRCNLTILLDKGYEDLAQFLSDHNVEIVASLPCYSEANVDQQRGKGTFEASIEALRLLNQLGYGCVASEKKLNLVYNPVGAHLPPEQGSLEASYKQRLREDFHIEFNQLYTITNMPITRYEKYLTATGEYENYVELLEHSFNAATVEGLMCRNTLSVGWDGSLYDCDFNQMLSLQLGNGRALTVHNVQASDLKAHAILTANHCFGCTAGAGSSCQGALKKG